MACLLFPLARVAFLLGLLNLFFFTKLLLLDFLKAQEKYVIFQLKFWFLSSVLLKFSSIFPSLTVID